MKKKLVLLLIGMTILLSACSFGTKSAKQLYKNGLEKLEDGNYEEAVLDLKSAIDKKSDKAEYYIAYGMALIRVGEYEEARLQLEKAVQDKDNKIARENNKKAYRGMGVAYFEQNDYENASAMFIKALEINELEELNKDILSYQADSLEKQLDYKGAIDIYSKLLDIDAKNAEIYSKRARLYSKSGDLEAAKKDYVKARDLAPNNYEVYLSEYYMYLEAGDDSAAASALEDALEIKVKDEEDKFYVARIHYLQGDFTLAKQEMSEAITNGYLSAYFYLGDMNQEEGNYQSAIKNYQKYIEAFPNNVSAAVYNQIGYCYIMTQEYEKALEMIQLGLALNDGEIQKALLYNEVVVYEKLIQFDKAYEKATNYLSVYKDDEAMQREYEFIKSRVNTDSERNTETNE